MTESKKQERKEEQVINPRAAGIDIGSRFHMVSVPPSLDEKPVRRFETYNDDLHQMADWLVSLGITTVAMESTGVYWETCYRILEDRGIEVFLVNSRHIKHVPGRKTDVLDCQWIMKLHMHGLVSASFVPRGDFIALRTYKRLIESSKRDASICINRMQKHMTRMNIQLANVVSDVTGVTGMAIMRAISEGQKDVEALAELRDPRCKASKEVIRKSLTGYYKRELIVALQQEIASYDMYQAKIKVYEQEIEFLIANMAKEQVEIDKKNNRSNDDNDDNPKSSEDPKSSSSSKKKHYISPGVSKDVSLLAGVDLTAIDGMGHQSALCIIAEIGIDMSRFKTSKNFTSWLGLSPQNKITGGRILSSKTAKSSNPVAATLRMAAVSLMKTQTALAAFGKKIASRSGKATAVTALARKLAVIIYNMIKHGTEFVRTGQAEYEKKYEDRILKGLKKKAELYGYNLIPAGSISG